MRTNRIVLIGALLLACSLAGCALFETRPPEESLRERVTTYMQARVDARWADVYEFFYTPYKETISKEQFLAMPGNMNFVGFTIENIDVFDSEKEAVVGVKVDFEVKGYTFKGSLQKQTWIKEGKTWYIKIPLENKPPF